MEKFTAYMKPSITAPSSGGGDVLQFQQQLWRSDGEEGETFCFLLEENAIRTLIQETKTLSMQQVLLWKRSEVRRRSSAGHQQIHLRLKPKDGPEPGSGLETGDRPEPGSGLELGDRPEPGSGPLEGSDRGTTHGGHTDKVMLWGLRPQE